MIDALTNLKNNKIKQDANGAVDNYTNLKKFIAGLKKRSGASFPPSLTALLTHRSQDRAPRPSVFLSPISVPVPPRASGGSSVPHGAETLSSMRSRTDASRSRSLRTRR